MLPGSGKGIGKSPDGRIPGRIRGQLPLDGGGFTIGRLSLKAVVHVGTPGISIHPGTVELIIQGKFFELGNQNFIRVGEKGGRKLSLRVP